MGLKKGFFLLFSNGNVCLEIIHLLGFFWVEWVYGVFFYCL